MDGTEKNAPAELCLMPFFPDGSRLFEEIDRLAFLTKVSVVFLLQKPVDGIRDQVRSFSAGGKPGEADRSGNRSD
jgi:hypothetical protein